jgi:DNA-binding LacI/PurR family transcriptional regulator
VVKIFSQPTSRDPVSDNPRTTQFRNVSQTRLVIFHFAEENVKVPRRVTLRDIAAAANVSIPTVSRVLTRSARVNPAIEKRVRDAATRLGFDLITRERRRTIAFLLGNRPIKHPFHSEVMFGAEAYCAEHDYEMLFSTLRYPLHARVSHLPIPSLLDRPGKVDGVIVAGVNTASMIQTLADTGLPVAFYGDTLVEEGLTGVPNVRIDENGGASEVTRYLVSLGHTAISFVANVRIPWFRRRYEAYRAAMESVGLRPALGEFDSEDERQVGYLATRSILDRPGRATAIFAGNDHIAQGVYEALRDRGLKVREQISVVGFNDTMEAVVLHPTLTTVRVYAEQIGRRLAELVLRQIESGSAGEETITIPTRIIKRESCAAMIHPAETAVVSR